MKTRILGSLVAIIALTLTVPTFASVLPIEFDMGTNQGVYSGNSAPGQATGAIPTTDNTWNGVTNIAGPQTVQTYADGTSAVGSGITYTLGLAFQRNTPTTTTDPNVWSYGSYAFDSGYASGVPAFYDNALMRDYLEYGQGIGMRIQGLPAGNYEVFVVSVEPKNTGRSWSVGIGVNPGVAQFSDTINIGPAGSLSSWVSATAPVSGNSNYAMQTVAISSTSDYLGIILTQNTSGSDSPDISAIQIVFLPEPASLSLLAVGGLMLLKRRRGVR